MPGARIATSPQFPWIRWSKVSGYGLTAIVIKPMAPEMQPRANMHTRAVAILALRLLSRGKSRWEMVIIGCPFSRRYRTTECALSCVIALRYNRSTGMRCTVSWDAYRWHPRSCITSSRRGGIYTTSRADTPASSLVIACRPLMLGPHLLNSQLRCETAG